MDQDVKPQVSGSTKRALAIVGLVVGLMFVAALLADANRGPSVPSATDDTRAALDELWLGYSSSERFDFCAEARAAGYEVVANEIAAVRSSEPREVRWWLEDRCG